jgi:FeS assembly SUF system protein
MWRKQSEFESAHAPKSDKPSESAAKGAVGPEPQTPVEASAAVVPEGERPSPETLQGLIVEELKTVFDPEIPVNIYELGLIYDVSVAEDGKASIRMTLTTPMCPAAEELPPEVETKARGVAGVTGVELELVWEPPWTPDMMSEAARLDLGMV